MELLKCYAIGSDPEIRAALVDCCTELAQHGKPEEVLELLGHWAENNDNLVWVICKTLSGSWAAAYPGKALKVLEAAGQKVGPDKQIHNTWQGMGLKLKSMQR
jgi:hypothetical protein